MAEYYREENGKFELLPDLHGLSNEGLVKIVEDIKNNPKKYEKVTYFLDGGEEEDFGPYDIVFAPNQNPYLDQLNLRKERNMI